MSERITSDILNRLRSRFPDLGLEVRVEGDLEYVTLPSASESDYEFELAFADGHEASLDARLKTQPRRQSDEMYFWYIPFEEPDYKSYEDRAEEIVSTVELVLRNRSRIIQTKRSLFWSLKAEVNTAGEWTNLLAHMGLKSQFRAPDIFGKRKVYHADAVLRAGKSVV